MKNGFILRDGWYFKLANPFGYTRYYPMHAETLANHLELSKRTALRICQDLRPIKKHELIYLQVMIFGLIPDPLFVRHKWFFKNGVLLSHNHKLEIDISDTTAFALLRQNDYLLIAELREAKERIRELELKLGLIKTNIIQFSDYFNKD